jgi:D-sedoheptulose 7-phosphate isomerase
MSTNVTLNSQASNFCQLVGESHFTDSRGNSLPHETVIGRILDVLQNTIKTGGNVYVIGNGGSAAVASHVVIDFCNVGKLRALTLHEPSVITCFSNDYGYEHVFSSRLIKMARKEDVLIAISSSGQSNNILNAVKCMRSIGAATITLTGFKENNSLRRLGDINYWVNSSEYGMVEIAHLFTLHHLSDRMGIVWQDSGDHLSFG